MKIFMVVTQNSKYPLFIFLLDGKISLYLVKIKVVSITSEMISYDTVMISLVTDTIYIYTPRFGYFFDILIDTDKV